jgi:hypothetical protein
MTPAQESQEIPAFFFPGFRKLSPAILSFVCRVVRLRHAMPRG